MPTALTEQGQAAGTALQPWATGRAPRGWEKQSAARQAAAGCWLSPASDGSLPGPGLLTCGRCDLLSTSFTENCSFRPVAPAGFLGFSPRSCSLAHVKQLLCVELASSMTFTTLYSTKATGLCPLQGLLWDVRDWGTPLARLSEAHRSGDLVWSCAWYGSPSCPGGSSADSPRPACP